MKFTPEIADRILSKSRNQITDKLWIGNLLSLRSDFVGDWTIVSLLGDERSLKLADDFLSPKENNIERVIWRVRDKVQANFLCEDLIRVLGEMDRAMTAENNDNDDNRQVLVHCAQGVSRSSAICAAWLMSRNSGLSLEQALGLIRKARPMAQPNMGFTAALKAIERHGGDVKAAMQEWQQKRSNKHPPGQEDTRSSKGQLSENDRHQL